jgi:putative ABC transport system permease protein
MLRVTLRGLQGHLVRLLLTASAVMLGVAFVAGTFVLRGSIDNSVSGLLTRATQGVDVSVRGVEVRSDGEGTGDRPGVPLALADTLRDVPGVARVSPDLQGSAIIAGRDGTAVRTGGAPTIGFAYDAEAPGFTLVEGR